MKFNFENILPDPVSFWSEEEMKTETKQSVSQKTRSSGLFPWNQSPQPGRETLLMKITQMKNQTFQ